MIEVCKTATKFRLIDALYVKHAKIQNFIHYNRHRHDALEYITCTTKLINTVARLVRAHLFFTLISKNS